MAKKSLYIFLSSLLGVMLFLLIDRVVVLLLVFLINGGFITAQFSASQFMAVDYIILSVVLMLGGWYGIWLGLYWYEVVYEQRSHRGAFHHFAKNYLSYKGPDGVTGQMEAVRKRIETDLAQLEDIAIKTPLADAEPQPIKRKIVRKRAPRIKV